MRIFRGLDRQLRKISSRIKPIFYVGTTVFCPICDQTYRKFRSVGRGVNRRVNAVCVRCKSRERDRFMFKYLSESKEQLRRENMTMLHFAPEPCLIPVLDEITNGFRLTTDLVRPDVMVHLNIENLPFADETIDAIYCSHVLQDVTDDRRALKEMYRVVRSTGWVIILIYVEGAKTVDRPSRRLPGDESTVQEFLRTYGTDFCDSTQEAGFQTLEIKVSQLMDEEEQSSYALNQSQVGGVFLLTK